MGSKLALEAPTCSQTRLEAPTHRIGRIFLSRSRPYWRSTPFPRARRDNVHVEMCGRRLNFIQPAAFARKLHTPRGGDTDVPVPPHFQTTHHIARSPAHLLPPFQRNPEATTQFIQMFWSCS